LPSAVMLGPLPAPRLGDRVCVRRRCLSTGSGDVSTAVEGAKEDSDGRTWLPIDSNTSETDPSGNPGTIVMPLFPLDGVSAYLPHSMHELNIFEPRYKKMYNDILFSGARRFVVADLGPDLDCVADVGVVLYLEDLHDVSEETDDQVKYVCNHRIIGRACLRRILNPSCWEDASTYLRAETVAIDDVNQEPISVEEKEKEKKEEADVMSHLEELSEIQRTLSVAQFSSDLVEHVNALRAEVGGLWTLAGLWVNYYDFLAVEREELLDDDVQDILLLHGEGIDEEDQGDEDQDYDEFSNLHEDYTAWGDGGYSLGQELFIEDLPREVQSDVLQCEGQFEEAVESMMREQALFTDQLLRTTSHRQRLSILGAAVRRECQRLMMKETLSNAVDSANNEDPPW